jgi:putative DNA primase/helicase
MLVTEDGAAAEFAELYGNRLRFCHDTGAWFEWDGIAWRQNRTGVAFTWARLLARKLATNEPDRVRYTTSKTSFATGVEKFARADPVLAVTIDTWDTDPFLFGTPAGTVDLRTGVLRASDPAEGITKLAGCSPTKDAFCPRWLQFLDDATGKDEAAIRFLQQWCGYSLTGDTREHALIFVYGPGGNGKSVFLNVVTSIMGDYATTAAMDTFTASHNDKHPTDLAMLRGARLVTASETEEGRAWAEARIKQMTGGDTVTARFMRQDFFSFRPTFKLSIVGNHKPALRNVDDAARRRFNIVPFTRKPANPDPELEAKLRAEWPQILRWMIDGCLDWRKSGLARAASVTEATQAYFTDQDMFGQWLEECCEVDPENAHLWDLSADLFASWAEFARKAGEPSGSSKTFGDAMRRKGFEQYRTMKARGFRGVRLRQDHSHAINDG